MITSRLSLDSLNPIVHPNDSNETHILQLWILVLQLLQCGRFNVYKSRKGRFRLVQQGLNLCGAHKCSNKGCILDGNSSIDMNHKRARNIQLAKVAMVITRLLTMDIPELTIITHPLVW